MFDVMTCLRMMSLHVMSSATCWVPLLRVCISSNSSEHLYLHGAINTFRPHPPSHHTVCDVMKPCFDAVKQNHSDATTLLKGLSSSSRQCLTSTMCLMLSKSSPDETCCFLKRFLLFKQPICAVYMPALHANDKKSRVHTCPKLAEHPCCKLQLLG